MPNWCNNDLTISGSYKDITDFYENNFVDNNNEYRETSKSLIFDYVAPKPKFDDPKEQELFDGGGWYNWCIDNWGTKWNADTDYFKYDPDNGLIEVYFETAWSPPIEWLIKAQNKYPHLTFNMSYYEDGMSFRGKAQTIDGVIDNQVWDMTDDDKKELGLDEVDYIYWK